MLKMHLHGHNDGGCYRVVRTQYLSILVTQIIVVYASEPPRKCLQFRLGWNSLNTKMSGILKRLSCFYLSPPFLYGIRDLIFDNLFRNYRDKVKGNCSTRTPYKASDYYLT